MYNIRRHVTEKNCLGVAWSLFFLWCPRGRDECGCWCKEKQTEILGLWVNCSHILFGGSGASQARNKIKKRVSRLGSKQVGICGCAWVALGSWSHAGGWPRGPGHISCHRSVGFPSKGAPFQGFLGKNSHMHWWGWPFKGFSHVRGFIVVDFLLPPAVMSPGSDIGVSSWSSGATLANQEERTVNKSFLFLNFLSSCLQCGVQVLLRFLSQVRRSRVAGEFLWPPILLHGKTGESGLINNLSLVCALTLRLCCWSPYCLCWEGSENP